MNPITEFGPFRAVGISYVGKNENNEIPQLWEKQLMPRMNEMAMPPQASGFGICRCVPGKRDGTFEYIGAMQVQPDAAVPEGMVEVEIPRAQYAVFEVSSLAEVKQAWQAVPKGLEALPDWSAYCGPAGCECASHPCFEYYPPDFTGTSKFFLYVPVKPKGA